jgi:hypothetical protein
MQWATFTPHVAHFLLGLSGAIIAECSRIKSITQLIIREEPSDRLNPRYLRVSGIICLGGGIIALVTFFEAPKLKLLESFIIGLGADTLISQGSLFAKRIIERFMVTCGLSSTPRGENNAEGHGEPGAPRTQDL